MDKHVAHLVLVVLTLLILNACTAARGRLPEPQTLVNRHIEAAYGGKGIDAQESMIMEGQLVIEDYNLKAPITLKLEVPDKRYFSTQLMGSEVIRTCMAGQCWTKELDAPVKQLRGQELAFMRELSDLYRLKHLHRYYQDLETVKISPFNGQSAYELQLTRQNGRHEKWYFSTETGLWIGGVWNLPEALGGTEITQYFDDYTRFDDLRLATQITEVTPNQTSKILIEEVRFEDIPDRDFALEN